jgi:hypothetical protein
MNIPGIQKHIQNTGEALLLHSWKTSAAAGAGVLVSASGWCDSLSLVSEPTPAFSGGVPEKMGAHRLEIAALFRDLLHALTFGDPAEDFFFVDLDLLGAQQDGVGEVAGNDHHAVDVP